jgi:hypothetical protein
MKIGEMNNGRILLNRYGESLNRLARTGDIT